MAKRKIHTQFVDEVYSLVGEEYSVLGVYQNNKKRILMRHNKCCHEWSPIPRDFLDGTRCPICCNRGGRKTSKSFKKEIRELTNNEYCVLGNYVNSSTKIEFLHSKCGHRFDMLPSAFLNGGQRCPNCFGNPKKDVEKLRKEIYAMVGDEYELLGEYVNTHTPTLIKHNTCGYEWNVAPNNFLQGARCLECYGNRRKTHDEFIENVKELVGDDYTVLGMYINSKDKIEFVHNQCGHQFLMSPSNFLYGTNRCPKCRKSKAEKKISNLLENMGVVYIQQFRIKECRNKQPLPFDFAIFNENNELLFLIEYDGEQHYKTWKMKDTKEAIKKLENIQKHDKIKTQFCIDNNIPLLRIPYWEFFSVEKIVKAELLRFKLIK